jgi:hypothetical protein
LSRACWSGSSSAIPILFNPHVFNNDIFVDGGLTSNVLLDEGIDFCTRNYPQEKIYIDVILCGSILAKDDGIKLNLIEILERIVYIIKQQVEYSELINHTSYKKLIVNLYEQSESSTISMVDFDHGEDLWIQGYTFSNVNVTYDIFKNL